MRHLVNTKPIDWTGIIVPALPPVFDIQNVCTSSLSDVLHFVRSFGCSEVQ